MILLGISASFAQNFGEIDSVVFAWFNDKQTDSQTQPHLYNSRDNTFKENNDG